MAAKYIVVRIELLYYNRRPINKSESIVRFSTSCQAIFFVGVLVNIWVNIFMFEYVERNVHFVISISPPPLTEESVFLIKIITTSLLFIAVIILGKLGRVIAIALSPKYLIGNYVPIKIGRIRSTYSIRIWSVDLSLEIKEDIISFLSSLSSVLSTLMKWRFRNWLLNWKS